MRLAHLHLPAYTRYTHAAQIQEALIQRHFLYKDSLRARSFAASTPQLSPISQPDPAILTFTCYPTYTVGRRYLSPPPSSTSSVPSSPSTKPTYHISPSQQRFLQGLTPTNSSPLASFHPTLRGGDLTFHGPGQLVAYPLIDLRRHRITPRAYIRLLENTIIQTCARLGVADTTTTENPGVWIKGGERKICAVGVQVQRGITGHGIGFNVRDEDTCDSRYEHENGNKGGMLSWAFERIVACGLQGKSVTWLAREGAVADLQVQDVANVLVDEFVKGLGDVEDTYKINERDVGSQNT